MGVVTSVATMCGGAKNEAKPSKKIPYTSSNSLGEFQICVWTLKNSLQVGLNLESVSYYLIIQLYPTRDITSVFHYNEVML